MLTVRTRHAAKIGFSLCALGLIACAGSIKTSHDYDPGADFRSFRTFAWISADPIIKPSAGTMNARYVSPLDEQRVRRAVESEMAKKGYRLAEQAASDLVVSFRVSTAEKVKIQDEPGMGRVYTSPNRGATWYGGSTVSVTQYTEGTLALEFYDRKSKRAVWVGTASKRLSKNDDSDEVIKEAVAKILLPFPARGEGIPSSGNSY